MKSIGWTTPAIVFGLAGTALFGLAALCAWSTPAVFVLAPFSPACLALVVWAGLVRYRTFAAARPVLRAEVGADREQVDGLNEAAFGQPPAGTRADAEISIVAEAAGWIVGHIVFRRTTIGATPALSLASLTVARDWQRRGIGTSLVKAGLDECRSTGHKIVVVLGPPGFFARFEFATAHPLGITAPAGSVLLDWMVLALVDGALEGVTGAIGSS